MKILIAPDSYKGTISSLDAIEIISQAAREVFDAPCILPVPMADGGEGTVDAIANSKAVTYFSTSVTSPMGTPVIVRYPITEDGTAILEMAAASGISLVPLVGKDPLNASSYGTGELILDAVNNGAKSIVMGIGGSATNDGGIGAMTALGVKFFDNNKNLLDGKASSLSKIDVIDISGLNPNVKSTPISVICDVTNPLLGKEGATYIYGPQKGVTPGLAPILEAGMKNYSEKLLQHLGKDISNVKGAGAAGGMGACLVAFLNAKLSPGIEVVLDTIGFNRLLEGVDLVVTGEGNIDGQSVLYGKVPTGIMKRCSKSGIPVLVIAGGMGKDAELFWQNGEGSIITTINAAMPIETALANAKPLLKGAAERAFRMIRMGMNISKNK